MGVKFDKSARDKIYKRLRLSMVAMERELWKQVWDAVFNKNKKPTIKISKEARDKYRKELYQMMMFFFQEAYRKKKLGVTIQVKEIETIDPQFLKAMQSAFTEKAAQYGKWFLEQATKLESKRFKDTVSRAEGVIETGIEDGLTRVQMRELMSEKFTDYSEYELDRVITTEGTRSMNLGTIAGCNDDENIVGYRYEVNYTGCDICDAKQAETAGDNWIKKEDMTEYPPFHPNCNCSVEPVFKDEIDQSEGD